MKHSHPFLKWTAVNALKTAAILGTITAAGAILLQRFQMIGSATELYILGVLLVSLNTSGYLWGIIAAVASVLCVNFFFTYPLFNLNFTIQGYPVTFLVMLTVAVTTSALGGRVKKQRELARERTRLTEERQQILIETEKEKMRGNLLRAISHDLRTPLTGILGASGALLDNGDLIDPESRRSLISGIHEDAEWLLRMVENVLSVTRITGGALSLKKVCEPLDEVFSQVAAKSRKRFPDIDLTMRMPDEVAMVPMDEMLIVQVLINLIDNAIRHGGSNRVELSAETEGDHVRMVVRDHGRGIPPEDLPTLFEGFGSRDRESSDSTRGLGIGLSICRTIVEGHGGHIFARNLPDGGACISFTLPIKEVTSYAES
ncbi:MAG: DUF4118 domain-containing protein [Butyricicoccus pullicaecorum]|nr:DUF4118 domain-containing protein [Butyricicoccus pullicaecorum]